jgi:hypothetical protein
MVPSLNKKFTPISKMYRGYDWALACIAVSNAAMDEIYHPLKG